MSKYCSRIPLSVVETARRTSVPWGPVGYVVYRRTYSRLREDLGRHEEWVDTVQRGIQGLLDYGMQMTEPEVVRLFEFWHQLKCMPAGRGLWQLGTPTVARIGSASLQNCWFTELSDIESFCFLFDMLMLGGGVGYSVLPEAVYKLPPVKEGVRVVRRDEADVDFVVPDNREGWVELLRKTLTAWLVTGRSFTYSTQLVRGKGTPIRGFGGVASGPEELVKGISQICGILESRSGQSLRPVDALDVANIIGSIVVSGNVRRSAQIAIGSPKDEDYLSAKNWSSGVIPNWRAMSNNTTKCSDTRYLGRNFWSGYEGTSEPYGLFNLNLSRTHGRIKDGPNHRPDRGVKGTNPCVVAGTEVLTREGYRPIESLVGARVEVWNGFEFSEVEPRVTGEDQPVRTVTLSSGRSLTCTDYHRFAVVTNYQGGWVTVEAKDLKIGDRLIKHDFPVLDGGDDVAWAYSQGVVSAEGMDGYDLVYLYDKKQLCTSRMHIRHTRHDSRLTYDRLAVTLDFEPLPKNFIPFRWSVQSRLDWLAGLFDGDGTVLKEGGIQVGSVDRHFLLEVQKLLSLLGTDSKVTEMHDGGHRELPDGKGGLKLYECKPCYRLLIGSRAVQSLVSLGLKCERLRLDHMPNRDASRFESVVGVKDSGTANVVYCFTEPKRHMGCFNGIVSLNCGEQSLENREGCCLVEQTLPLYRDLAEFHEGASLIYRVAKTMLHLPSHWPESTEVMSRNMRMGIGVTGVCQSRFTWAQYDEVYRHLEELDVQYSKAIGRNRSVKLTTVKPSGTLSLLPGVTPGIHPAYAPFYLRRIRFSSDDPLVRVARQHGYHCEPVYGFDGTPDHGTTVVEFPVKTPEDALMAAQTTAIGQLEHQKAAQHWWSDNAVSVTVYYRKDELPHVQQWLKDNYRENLKSCSFLLHSDHGFKQAPLEEITREHYEALVARTKPITGLHEFDPDEDNESQRTLQESLECTTGGCPIR